MTTRVLYLPCHATLEYDILKSFMELGYETFSSGHYADPNNPIELNRGPLTLNIDKNIQDEFLKLNPNRGIHNLYKPTFSIELLNYFDVVVVSCFQTYLRSLWNHIKHKTVIYETVGQSNPGTEQFIKPYRDQGLKIVRVSEQEQNINGYCGCDAVIRPIVDADIYKGWTGENKTIFTANNNIKTRRHHCNFDTYCNVTEGLPRTLCGKGNENVDFSIGAVSNDKLKELYRTSRLFLSMGTIPAPFTYTFAEALMTGCPVVTIGPKLGNFPQIGESYAAYKFLTHKINGYWSDDLVELRSCVELLLNDHDLAKEISKAGRERAEILFDTETYKESWKKLIKENT